MMIKEGIILKGIGGFYYVETGSGVFECKAKGKFRNKKIFNLTVVGLMTAIATVIYMVFPEINIVPGVSHLKVDFSDFPAILTGVVFGPIQGILVEVIKIDGVKLIVAPIKVTSAL
mgnify:CR=1 FL=1